MACEMALGLCVVFLALSQTCCGFNINFDLCGYLIDGGTCESQCEFEARHSWGIPMCVTRTVETKCCIPLDHPLLQPQRSHTADTTTPLTTTTTTTTTTIATTTEFQLFPLQCGTPHHHSRVRRVIGGRRAPPGAWPWQVAIRDYLGQYLCGGVLINQRWVLTAAHCFPATHDNPRLLRVYVGDQTLSYGKDGRNKTINIQRVVKHPGFRQNVVVTTLGTRGPVSRFTRHFNDIALVELGTNVRFTDTVQPVCLPGAFNDIESNTDDCWVTGWGETNGNHESSVQDLHEVRGKVLDNLACGERWESEFADDIVCFGHGLRGPCKGDSGGGVTCKQPDGRYKLVGVVSWGRDDCIHDDHPSVLTRVSAYQDWIDATITQDTDMEPVSQERGDNHSDA